MSLSTEFMRSTDQRIVGAGKNKNGTWSAYELVNHPTPSGCERWMPTYSDNRQWPDEETAKREFEAILPKPMFPTTQNQER